MKAAISRYALELGFDDCRFTTAEPPKSGDQFLKWLECRCHGTMDWMGKNATKRSRAHVRLPARAQTVIQLTFVAQRSL